MAHETAQPAPFEPDATAPVIHTGRWLPGEMHRIAVMSADGTYRWSLQRQWDNGPMIAWVMLNPSTADAYTDDPTIRRCIGFTRAWGYGGFTVVNLYALRSTDPKTLLKHPDPIGPDNDAELAFVADSPLYPLIMLAWGARAPIERASAATKILHRCYDRGAQLATLGWTKGANPRHPLYVRGDTGPTPWYSDVLLEIANQEPSA